MKNAVTSLVLFSLLLFGGCAALPRTIAVDPAEASAIRNATITVTQQQTQDFMFNTPTGALVDGTVAVWVDVEKGVTWETVQEANEVPDFNSAVAASFIDEVAGHVQVMESGQVEAFDPSADFSRLTSKYSSDYIVEIRTLFGSFHYGPMSWQTYYMNYTADLVVVRRSDATPVWKLACSIKAEDDNPLTVPAEDFLQEDGDKLRAAAAYATSYCGEQLAREFLTTLGA